MANLLQSIRVQITLGFVVLTAIIIFIGVTSSIVTRELGQSIRFVGVDLAEVNSKTLQISTQAQSYFAMNIIFLRVPAYATDVQEEVASQIQGIEQTLLNLHDEVVSLANSAQIRVGDVAEARSILEGATVGSARLQELSREAGVLSLSTTAKEQQYTEDIDGVIVEIQDLSQLTGVLPASVMENEVRPFAEIFLRLAGSLRNVSVEQNPEAFNQSTEQNRALLAELQQRAEELAARLGPLSSDLDRHMSVLTNALGADGHVQTHAEYLQVSVSINDALRAFRGSILQYEATMKTVLIDPLVVQTNEANRLAESFMERSLISSFIIISVALLLSIGITVYIFRLVSRCMGGINGALNRIAQGDLTASVPALPTTEFGLIAEAVNKLAQELSAIIEMVVESTKILQNSANEAIEVSESTQHSVSDQQEQTQSVATAVTQMEAAIAEVAQNASSSSDSVTALVTSSKENMNTMQRTLDLMTELKQSIDTSGDTVENLSSKTTQVKEVLGVIESIAEQTNLLALNAAIEAARAGEQGRGFAVVADEVRNLASKSSQSATEIRDVIDSLQQESQAVVSSTGKNIERAGLTMEQTEQSRQAMQDIIDSLSGVDEMAASIATASEEQTSVAKEVAASVVFISDQSQHIGDGANKVTETSASLKTLADDLTKYVSNFRV